MSHLFRPEEISRTSQNTKNKTGKRAMYIPDLVETHSNNLAPVSPAE